MSSPIEARRRSIFRRVTHYITTHKELLAADAIVFLGQAADAASTVHAQRICPTCIETNPILGKHPNQMAVWGWAIGSSALTITLFHLENRYAPGEFERHLIWAPAIALAIHDAMTTKSNVENAATSLALKQARARVSEVAQQ